MPTFKVWFNKGTTDPKKAWVVQMQPDKDSPVAIMWEVERLEIYGFGRFVEMDGTPDATPKGWFEVEGAILQNGQTNTYYIYNDKGKP